MYRECGYSLQACCISSAFKIIVGQLWSVWNGTCLPGCYLMPLINAAPLYWSCYVDVTIQFPRVLVFDENKWNIPKVFEKSKQGYYYSISNTDQWSHFYRLKLQRRLCWGLSVWSPTADPRECWPSRDASTLSWVVTRRERYTFKFLKKDPSCVVD